MTKRLAFTLAEVLITLGIIGVVAAMTIPTLVADYNKKVWDTNAEVFEKKLEAALKVMNTEMTLLGHNSTASFVDELSKHFKMTKVCQNDELLDCFPNEVYWGSGDTEPELVDMSEIKVAKDFGQTSWNTELISVLFANGIAGMIAYNPTEGCKQDPYSNQISGSDCLAILYDTSAFKSPNTGTKDLRGNKFVTKLGKFCALDVDGTCYSAAFKPQAHFWNACSGGTSSDPEDMEIMRKYGIDSCCWSSECKISDWGDRWAGAVIACGGVDRMPTYTELRQLRSFLYNGSYLDMNKVSALSITLYGSYGNGNASEDRSAYATIFSGELSSYNNGNSATSVDIQYREHSYATDAGRFQNNVYAICK